MRTRTLLLVAASMLAASAGFGQESKQEKAVTAPRWQLKPFSLENAAAGFKVSLEGYLQADLRSFHGWPPENEEGRVLPADEFDWRRMRIGVEGEWRRLSFEFQVDPAFDEGDELKDATVGLRITRELRICAGYMKLPVSAEFLTSVAKSDFVERAALVDALAPARDWGAAIQGELGRAFEYQVGLFDGDGHSSAGSAGTTVASRLVVMPTRWLDLGGSFSQGKVEASLVGPGLDPEPRGFSERSVTQYEFFEPVFVDGQRQRWGVDARIQAGPVSLWAERLEQREERLGQGPSLEDLPEVRGSGWSTTATWLITGEKKGRTVNPDRPLIHGPGAVEVSVRYESLKADDVDNEGFESAGNRAGNIRPAGYDAFTGGLSWWPSPFLRLMGDAVLERYHDALRAPESGKEGNYVSFLARIQVHLP